MTAAYDLFVRELQAQGRERLDGLSLGNLRQLTPDEHTKVLAALTQAIALRDSRAPIALAVLEPTPATVAVLRTAAPLPAAGTAAPDHFTLECAAAIGVLEVAPDALDLLEQTFRTTDDTWSRGIATDGLRRAHTGSDASARLARLVRTQQDEELKLDAADTLLLRHGWRLEDAQRKAETLTLMRAMIGGDTAARDAALLKVLKTPVQGWPRP